MLSNTAEDLNLTSTLFNAPITIFNDNNACVFWSQSLTTKGLRHLQIRENAVRESIDNKFINVHHIGGAINPSDLFTKEDKDATHYLAIRDVLVTTPPPVSVPAVGVAPNPCTQTLSVLAVAPNSCVQNTDKSNSHPPYMRGVLRT